MHILIIPSSLFLTPLCPLGGIFESHQASALCKNGFRVGVLGVGFLSPRLLLKPYPYTKEEELQGVNVMRCYQKQLVPSRFLPITYQITSNAKLGMAEFKKYVNEYGLPDCVHAHNIHFAGFLAAKILEEYGVPFILTEHSSSYVRDPVSSSWLNRYGNVLRLSAHNTAVSTVFAKLLEKTFIEHHVEFSILPNILAPSFEAKQFSIKSRHSGFVFLNIAHLDANKDHETLIRAFAMAFKDDSTVLRIGGAGPLERRLRSLACVLGVEKKVDFLGYLDRENVWQEMNQADCFVLSSQYETFGVVLIEALSVGTPLIATRCGGPVDVVTEDNGLLVPINDVGAMAASMQYMVLNHARYDPIALRNQAISDFGDAAFIRRVKQFYESALSG